MIAFDREVIPLFFLAVKSLLRGVFAPSIVYPRVVNFSATNKCNYRCVMCNVWRPEHSSERDMTPDEVFKVFSNPLFKKVKHVGVSGGEPFIRTDIREVFQAICTALPSLKGISVITNASVGSTPQELSLIKDDLEKRSISLDVEVSIDGIQGIHDVNRGFKGAYEKTFKTFKALKAEGLVQRISTTITKENVGSLFQTYRLARQEGVPIDFRLSSLINRLYNNDIYANFRLSEADSLKAIKFLENIIYYHEGKNLYKKLFYRSLIGQLKGEARHRGCDYRTSFGVSMDPYAGLYFCFPRSALVENIKKAEGAGLRLLKENGKKLLDTHAHCASCTHDYFGLPDPALAYRYFYDRYIRGHQNTKANTRVLRKRGKCQDRSGAGRVNKAAIVGWYGTETLGDKFILKGILQNLFKEGFGPRDITLVSLHPTYSRLTLLEFGLEAVSVVDAYGIKNDPEFIASQDAFIFGGGPLCDIEPMVDMLTIFENAKRLGKKTFIYAAGIGPLKEKRYIEALNRLLECTDRFSFRDSLCVNKYRAILPRLAGAGDRTFIDPATNYIRAARDKTGREPAVKERYALFSFRDWLYMYADGLTKKEFEEKNTRYEDNMQALIEKTLSMGFKAVLFPMSTFYIGGDDREYYLQFLKRFKAAGDIILVDHEYAPEEALNYFKHAAFSVCLRYHSIVSSIAMNTPCIAIEYHYGGGKISGFMEGLGLMDHVYSVDAFAASGPEKLIGRALSMRFDWGKVNGVIDEKNDSLFEYMRLNGHV
ncbi:MAG: polysaccharide pyruvyl transferase family protein [Deltaproteobacteria bacterium]